jgi:hypothetical protein
MSHRNAISADMQTPEGHRKHLAGVRQGSSRGSPPKRFEPVEVPDVRPARHDANIDNTNDKHRAAINGCANHHAAINDNNDRRSDTTNCPMTSITPGPIR